MYEDANDNTQNISVANRAILIIVLTYILYGIINYFSLGVLIFPSPYIDFFVFGLSITLLVPLRESIKVAHILLILYSTLSILEQSFLWEIFLNQQQQESLQSKEYFNFISNARINVFIIFVLTFWNGINYKLVFFWRLTAISTIIYYFILKGAISIGTPIYFLNHEIRLISFFIPLGVIALITLFMLKEERYSKHQLIIVVSAIALLYFITYVTELFL